MYSDDSPVAHILTTNNAPSDAEAGQIRDYVSHHLKDLHHLDDEVARIEAVLDSLYCQRNKLKSNIDAHQVLLSPVRRLPRELLQEIFISCLPTNRNAVMSARDVPVLLGQVCSLWRAISLSTAELWSSLHIVVPNHPTKAQRKLDLRRDLVELWLGRSGACPLSISLVAAEYAYGIDAGIVSPLIDALIAFSHRWKNMEFKVPFSSLDFLTKLRKEDVPLLENIKFGHIPDFAEASGVALDWGQISILESAPRLRGVRFVDFQDDISSLPLPWDRLSELGLEALTWSTFQMDAAEALNVLHRCPNLSTLSLQMSSSYSPPISPPLEAISHSKLQSLSVAESDSLGLTEFFDHLILPELRHLEIRGSVAQPFPHTPTLSWLTSPLQSLTLYQVSISEDALIECLRLVPSLNTLCINDLVPVGTLGWGPYGEPIVSDTLLGFLTLARENATSVDLFGSALEDITFTRCGSFSDEALLDFIKSRFKPIHADIVCLKRVEISLYRDTEPNTMIQVQALRKAGLQISLEQPRPYPGYSDYPWEGVFDPLWEPRPKGWWCVVVTSTPSRKF